MTANEGTSSKMARERWKILANVLTQKDDNNVSLLSSVSVRRFQGFGLFKAVECKSSAIVPAEFQSFEYFSTVERVPTSRIQITVRKKNVGLQINELSGFDNTGNILSFLCLMAMPENMYEDGCNSNQGSYAQRDDMWFGMGKHYYHASGIWPSEEVLAYYLLKHRSNYEGKCVCELGAGMTALAGIMLAANSAATEVCLTDGNQQSVNNIKRIIASNSSAFADTKVYTRTMVWGENAMMPEIKNKYDLIVASDCLFYVESHKDLLCTVDALLSPKGHAIFMSPHRAGTLQKFCSTASLFFEVQIIIDYDELISAKRKEAQALGKNTFDEDLHYPVMVLLQRKQHNGLHNLIV